MPIRPFSVMIMLFVLLAVTPCRADQLADEAGKFLRETIEKVMQLLRTEDVKTPEGRERVMAVINPAFDFELMAKLTLGEHWRRLSPEQQKEFVDMFVAELRESYLDKSKEFADSALTFETPSTLGGGRVQMAVQVDSKGEKLKTLYKAVRRTEWRVYDVEVQDVSIVSSYRSQYRQFLNDKGVEALLAEMRQKRPPAAAGAGR